MNDVQAEKKHFTERHLTALLREATDGDVSFAEYAVTDGEEFVHVVFANGYRKRVCVSGDSKKALARDVLRQL